MDTPETRDTLLKRVRGKRESIKLFLQNLEPAGIRLTNLNVICGAIATVLTATPAIGGNELLNALVNADPNSSTWRIWVSVAALFSLLSTIAANIYKSRDIASRLGKAQAVNAKLEGLETLLDLNQIDINKAAIDYAQLISEISFISATHVSYAKRLNWIIERATPRPIHKVKGEINEPQSKQVEGSTILCSGWVKGMGLGHHLWLVVEKGKYFWPKEREISVDFDGSWKHTIFEEGTAESFSLSLFVVDNKANKEIQRWFDEGDSIGNYKEMSRPPHAHAHRVTRIDGLHRKSISEE